MSQFVTPEPGITEKVCLYTCLISAIAGAGFLIFKSCQMFDETKYMGKGAFPMPENPTKKRPKSLLQEIKIYQTEIAPWMYEHGLKGDCPYEPSCSEYGRQAIEKYGNVKGSVMAVKRVGRCRPGTKGGYDPVV